MSKRKKRVLIILSVFVLILVVVISSYNAYINKYRMEGQPHDTLIYNGMRYTWENHIVAHTSSKTGLKFVGLTRWTPIGVWCPVYAEDVEVPSFLVYGFISKENHQNVYWLEGTHQRLDTDFARFDLSTSGYGEVIYTTTDTFLLRNQVAAQPEYVTTSDGLRFSNTGLEYLCSLNAFFESPEDCCDRIGIYKKDGCYYLEGYNNCRGDFRTEYYLIQPDSELMEFVEMINAHRSAEINDT